MYALQQAISNIGQKITWSPHITWLIQNVGVHPASGGWRPLYAGRWAYTSNFVKYILFFLNENKSSDEATISHIIRLLTFRFMSENMIWSAIKNVYYNIFLQDYDQEL